MLNHTKLFLFNNNTRRITNLTTVIIVQFVFICARIYETEVNASYPSVTIQALLPLIVHIVLMLNVLYNYAMLVLQILDRNENSVAKV